MAKKTKKKLNSFPEKTHGESRTRLYHIWVNMHHRNYKSYAPKVCDEWADSYETFRDWALTHGYRDDLTIDRINPRGDYRPSNCRWITGSENSRRARVKATLWEKTEIYYYRKRHNLTQWQMTDLLGVALSTVGKWEREVRESLKGEST